MGPDSLCISVVTVANLPQGMGRTARLRTLAAALVGMGHRVEIWNQHSLETAGMQQASGDLCGARYEYVLGTTERERGFRAIKLKLQAVSRILRKVRKAVQAGELDLILFNNLAFYDTFPITRLARRLGVPTIQCYEDERLELLGKVGLAQRIFGWNSWLADRFCSPLADQIWVISSYLREKYVRLSGHPERVRIIPTIVDCEAWSLPSEPIHTAPLLLYSGSFGEQDDIEKLVQTLACLKRQSVAFRMRFLGANPENERVRQLQSLIRELEIQDCVDLVGFCTADEVKQEVANANILVNLRTSSIWSRSGLSTKLSEYLAAGRAVLTTDVGDNARYVEHGKSALLVPPDALAEEVAEVLKQAIEHPEWRKSLGAAARQAALAHFHLPVVQKVISDALANLPGLRAAV
jgi:glycosyltransferase involved in cell wall biosynthesis